MEIVTVETGKGEAGIVTGGDRTLQEVPTTAANSQTSEVKLPETDAELEARRNNILRSMGWGGEAIPAATTPAAPASPATPETPATPAAPAAPETPAATAPAAPATVAPTTEELINRTATAVGDKVAAALAKEPAQPTPATPAAPEMTPEDVHTYQVIQKMEALGTAPKGHAEAFKAFAFKRYAYEAQWLADNPGKDFDPDDHDEFYKAQPDIDEQSFEAAKIKLLVDQEVAARINAEVAPKLQAIEAEKALEAARPVIATNVGNRVVEMVKKVDPAIGNILVVDGKINLSKDNIDRVFAADPIAAPILNRFIMEEVHPMVVALEMSILPGQPKLNPLQNPLHAEIAKHVHKFEDSIIKGPESGKVRDGRQFLTSAQYGNRVENIMNSSMPADMKTQKMQELEAGFWMVSIDDVQTVIVADAAERARKQIDEIEGMAVKKYGKPAAAPATPAPAPTTPAPVTPTPATTQRQRPPALSSSPTPVDTAPPGAAKSKTFGETATETHWRR